MKEEAIIKRAKLEDGKLLFEVVIWSKTEEEKNSLMKRLELQKDKKQSYTMKIENPLGDKFKTIVTYDVPYNKEDEILDILMR